ncbi:MAG: Ig-like domain-containing protein [Eubacteriales bacterium]|nr:Ig-like domain-containing protein [Eubacteriales bacterium]
MKSLKKWKNYLAAALLLAALCLIPSGTAEAAKFTMTGWWLDISSVPRYTTDRKIIIDAGQTFDLSPYFFYQKNSPYESGHVYKTGDQLSLTFTSSKPSVATVGKKTGVVTAKKAGTTKITVTYKKKTYTCTLTVKKKGTLGTTTTYKKLNSAAKALEKYYNKKVTSSNIVSLLQKAATYYNQEILVKKGVIYGFLGSSDKLIVPNYLRVSEVLAKISDYAYQNNPESKIKFTKASGTSGSNSISVTLNLKPTKTQIYLLQYANRDFDKALKFSDKTATFYVSEAACDDYVGDDEDNPDMWSFSSVHYTAKCTVTKGSKTAVVKLYDEDGKSVKLKKDYVYRLNLNDTEITFTAK